MKRRRREFAGCVRLNEGTMSHGPQPTLMRTTADGSSSKPTTVEVAPSAEPVADSELLEAPREPDEMTYAEIDRLARILERTGGNARELLVKREQKLSIPFATLVVILFGAPLATSSKRGGNAYGIGVSLATLLVYILMMKVSQAFGEAGTIDALTAAWLPNVIFLAAAAVLMVRVKT